MSKQIAPPPLTQDELDACEGILAGESPLVAFQKSTGKGRIAFGTFWDKPEIQAYLAARRMELREITGFSDRQWLDAVSDIAFFDPIEIALADIQCPADIAFLPARVRKMIVGWSWDRNEHFTLKFADKQRAQDMLAKNQGLYQQDRMNEHDAANLLQQAFWRFVFALHVSDGISIPEAELQARSAPDEAEAWCRAKGLIGPGDSLEIPR